MTFGVPSFDLASCCFRITAGMRRKEQHQEVETTSGDY
jgi:hypothetical protein